MLTSAEPTNDKIFKVDCRKSLLELKDVLQRYIEFAVSNNAGAKDITARQLGIDRKTLYKRLIKK
jgi:DNA-binding NtrC family response regulator